MKPVTTTELIRGMGYCCPWLFFQLFPSGREAAFRLGIHERTIREVKRKTRDGCPGCEGCLREKLPALLHVVEVRRQVAQSSSERNRS